MNHGIGHIPAGFDPKRGLTEEEYEGLVTRDHPITDAELRNVALSESRVQPRHGGVHPYPGARVGSQH